MIKETKKKIRTANMLTKKNSVCAVPVRPASALHSKAPSV